MGISMGWHLPSPGRSMSIELIPAQEPLRQHSTNTARTRLRAPGPMLLLGRPACGTGSSAPSPQLRQTYCGEPGNFLVPRLPLLRSVFPPPFLLLFLVLVRALSAAQRPCLGRVPRGFASPSSALSRREVGTGLSERGVQEEEISKPCSERCPGLALRGAGSAPAWGRPTPLRSPRIGGDGPAGAARLLRGRLRPRMK